MASGHELEGVGVGGRGLKAVLPAGQSCHYHQRLDSTSLEAWRRLAAGGIEPGGWVVADRQMAGYGRRASVWASPPGNLYASIFLRLDISPSHIGQLAILAGLAAFEAISQLAPADLCLGDLCLKWPNDILLGGGKAGGVLVESRPLAEAMDGTRGSAGEAGRTGGAKNEQAGKGSRRPLAVVMGFGINILSSPEIAAGGKDEIDGGIDDRAGQGSLFPPTHLHHHGWDCGRDELFQALARSLRDWLAIWRGGDDFNQPRLAWMERSCHIGRIMKIRSGKCLLTGRCAGIDDLGRLLLAGDDGERFACHSGHVEAIG